MLEIPERVNYGEWDNLDFVIPTEFQLTDDSFLHEAIHLFYAAGGYDFFQVYDAEKYASNWLDFIGNLYCEIETGKYKADGQFHKNPLSDKDRVSLKEQGVPKIFTDDICI